MATSAEVHDEFGGEIKQTDLTLIIEDHKIPVSKAVLCIASPVFRAMLEGDFQEKSKTEITLPGKNFEDFVEFLRCIYPNRLKKVTVKNAYQLLPLAHEYQVQKIQNRCEKVIGQIVRKKYADDVIELYRHIQMSETFSLGDLKETCMYMVSDHKLEEFEKGRGKYHISVDSHLKVIKLALRKRELNSEDEESFTLSFNGKDVTNSAFTFGVPVTTSASSVFYGMSTFPCQNDIQITLTGNVKEHYNKPKDFLRALRLAKRFNITENNIRLRIMENLKQMKDLPEELKEEFKLLPEEIKQIVTKNK